MFKSDTYRSSMVRELALFCIGAFAPAAGLGFYAAQSGGIAHHPGFLPLAMLTPMLSALVIQKATGRKILGPDGLGFRWGKLRWWLIGPIVAAVLVSVSLAISVAVNPAILASATEISGHLAHGIKLPAQLGAPATIALSIMIAVLVAPYVNLPILLGEEVGWRGFMNPRLTALFGRPGRLIGGGIWAAWHLPFILLGLNYPGHPWLGMLIWLPVCACLNVLLQWLRQASGSILPCALSHGAMNQLAMTLLIIFFRESRFNPLLDGLQGLIGLALLLPPTIWAYRRINTLDQAATTSAPGGAGVVAAPAE